MNSCATSQPISLPAGSSQRGYSRRFPEHTFLSSDCLQLARLDELANKSYFTAAATKLDFAFFVMVRTKPLANLHGRVNQVRFWHF